VPRRLAVSGIVLGMDVKKVDVSGKIPSSYEIVIHGGRKFTGIDALWWAKKAEALGAGEICLNSIDADGTQTGYELTLTALISENVHIPVIASGGAGKPQTSGRSIDQRQSRRGIDCFYGGITAPIQLPK